MNYLTREREKKQTLWGNEAMVDSEYGCVGT